MSRISSVIELAPLESTRSEVQHLTNLSLPSFLLPLEIYIYIYISSRIDVKLGVDNFQVYGIFDQSSLVSKSINVKI